MENAVQIFTSEEFGEIRTAGTPDNPKFCLADVCRSLELDASQVMKRLDGGVVSIHPITDKLGRTQNANFINEDGLYDVILDSRKPSAKKFRKWITSEVLPSIRKTGGYLTPQKTEELLNNPDLIIGLCQKLKAERAANEKLKAVVESQKAQIGELTPKADYCDMILQSKEALPITVIAKDYGMSAQKMNDTLHRLGIQYKLKGGTWIVYQKYANQGYTCTKTFPLEGGKSATSTQWTQKGRRFLYVTLKRNGVIPLIEQANSDFDTNGQIFLIKEYDETALTDSRADNESERILH